ncbi:unnamed protein product [Choristocarpus tenellus]
MQGSLFYNAFGEACPIPWPDSYQSLQDYSSRAWCRLEVHLCTLLPLPAEGFRYFVHKQEASRFNDRPHFLYGDYQQRRKVPPECLPKLVGCGWLDFWDPADGA